MKRICLIGAAVAALLLLGVSSALAARPHASAAAATKSTKTKAKTKTAGKKVTCTLSLTQQAPAGATDVSQGATDGTQMGSAVCGTLLGSGVQNQTFATDGSGNLSGKYQQYFGAGEVYGAYALTPADSGPPTTTSFTSSSYTGTVTVTGGSGVDKKATGKGTLACSSADDLHYTCTEHLKLVLPASTTATTKS